MRVSRSCRDGSSSDATSIFASSCCCWGGQLAGGGDATPGHGAEFAVRRRGRWGGRATYVQDDTATEAGAPVEPVIVLELVDLDALAIVARPGDLCHGRGAGLPPLRPGLETLRSEECGGEGSAQRARGCWRQQTRGAWAWRADGISEKRGGRGRTGCEDDDRRLGRQRVQHWWMLSRDAGRVAAGGGRWW